MSTLLTIINNGGANADSGGCWQAAGRRLVGTTDTFSNFPYDLELNGVVTTLTFLDTLPLGDGAEITDWIDCFYEYLFIYSCNNTCPEATCYNTDCDVNFEYYIFDPTGCCNCCTASDGLGLTVPPTCTLIVDCGGVGDLTDYSVEVKYNSINDLSTAITEATLTGAPLYLYNPLYNGYYWAIWNKVGCTQITEGPTLVNCAQPCSVSLGVLSGSCGEAGFFATGAASCQAPVWQWQYGTTAAGPWADLVGYATQTIPAGFIPFDGWYRVWVTNCPSCPTQIFSAPVQINLGCGGPQCFTAVTLTLNNCVLTASATNCPTPNYQFDRSINGGPWVTVQTGPSNTYTPTTDAFFRVEVTGCPNCQPQSSLPVVVGNCANCDCPSLLIAENESLCIIEWNECGTGYTYQMQRSNDGVSGWADVTSPASTSPFAPESTGYYRLEATKTSCSTIYSNVVNVTDLCCPTPCTYTINLPNGCTSGSHIPGVEGVYKIVIDNDSNTILDASMPYTCNDYAQLVTDLQAYEDNNDGYGTISINTSSDPAILTISDTCTNYDRFWVFADNNQCATTSMRAIPSGALCGDTDGENLTDCTCAVTLDQSGCGALQVKTVSGYTSGCTNHTYDIRWINPFNGVQEDYLTGVSLNTIYYVPDGSFFLEDNVFGDCSSGVTLPYEAAGDPCGETIATCCKMYAVDLFGRLYMYSLNTTTGLIDNELLLCTPGIKQYAMNSNGVMYSAEEDGSANIDIRKIDYKTCGSALQCNNLISGPSSFNVTPMGFAMATVSTGYIATRDGKIYYVNVDTCSTLLVNDIGLSHTTQGDLAIIGNYLYLTANPNANPSQTDLIRFDITVAGTAASPINLGMLPSGSWGGLAHANSNLYGFSGSNIYLINTILPGSSSSIFSSTVAGIYQSATNRCRDITIST